MIIGFRLYFAGLRFWLGHRSLVRLSFFPLIINATSVLTLMALTATKIPELAAKFLPSPTIWYQTILYYGGLVLFGGSALIVSYFVGSLLANLINISFYDLLAERSLVAQKALESKSQGLSYWMKRTSKNLGAMAKKLVVLGFLTIFIIIMNFIPGLSLLVIPLAALIVTSDVLDYSFDLYGQTFSQRLAFYKANFSVILGFAFGVALFAAIPILNLLIMPGQVVAASVLLTQRKGHIFGS